MLGRLLALTLLAIIAGAGIWFAAGGDDGARATRASPLDAPPRPDTVRDCRTHVEGRLPPIDRRTDLVVGPVRFRGFRAYSRRAARGRPGDWFEIRDDEYHSLKVVTEVRAGVDVIVAIAPANRRLAGMLYKLDVAYGRYGVPFRAAQQTVRFRACRARRPAEHPRFYRRATVGPWTQFNGGFLFTRPQCLRLDVYVRGREPRRFTEPFARSRKGCST